MGRDWLNFLKTGLRYRVLACIPHRVCIMEGQPICQLTNIAFGYPKREMGRPGFWRCLETVWKRILDEGGPPQGARHENYYGLKRGDLGDEGLVRWFW